MVSGRFHLLLCSVLVLTNVLCTALHHRSKSKSTTHDTPRADPSNDEYTLHFRLWRDPDTFADQCNLGVTDSNVSLWYRNASELEWTPVVGSFFNTEHGRYCVIQVYAAWVRMQWCVQLLHYGIMDFFYGLQQHR